MNQARTRRRLGGSGRSVIAQVYGVLWRRGVVWEEDRTRYQHNALCIAASMSRAYRDGGLMGFLRRDRALNDPR